MYVHTVCTYVYPAYKHMYCILCVCAHIRMYIQYMHTAVRNKEQMVMNMCPSINILGQTISVLLKHSLDMQMSW